MQFFASMGQRPFVWYSLNSSYFIPRYGQHNKLELPPPIESWVMCLTFLDGLWASRPFHPEHLDCWVELAMQVVYGSVEYNLALWHGVMITFKRVSLKSGGGGGSHLDCRIFQSRYGTFRRTCRRALLEYCTSLTAIKGGLDGQPKTVQNSNPQE